MRQSANHFELGCQAMDAGRHVEAFHAFEAGAASGDESCFLNLGYCFDVGHGVDQNVQLALRWYRRAYRRGSASAASNIGTVYRDSGDSRRALWWFHRAKAMGDGDSLVEIARIHQSQSPHLAERYYALAAKHDSITEAGREHALAWLAQNSA